MDIFQSLIHFTQKMNQNHCNIPIEEMDWAHSNPTQPTQVAPLYDMDGFLLINFFCFFGQVPSKICCSKKLSKKSCIKMLVDFWNARMAWWICV